MLRPIKNLRNIAVTPVADVQVCAEQIKDDYVISWRPNPTELGLGVPRDMPNLTVTVILPTRLRLLDNAPISERKETQNR